jgi:GYF domain 2
MNYFISRDGQQYGPYTLADLQRYVSSGDVLLTDMALSEGMSEPLPVSQIIGTISVPQAPVSRGPVSLAPEYPDPPNLHWALVLLFGVISCGLFISVWDLVQAAWMNKVTPQSKAIYYYAIAMGLLMTLFTLSFLAGLNHTHNPLASLVQLANLVMILIGRYSLKSSLEEHYNSAEPMGLLLSGVMTFFFGCIYFQYHLNDIVRRKNLDRLDLQTA